VLRGEHDVAWFEVITENVLAPGGNPRRILRAVRERWPVVLHGVSLGIGGPDPLDEDYLRDLCDLATEVEPAWVSDHLCWGGLRGRRAHDLWPLPLHDRSLAHVSARVQVVQERLGRPLVLENVSAYVTFRESTWPEGEFLAELSRRTGCGLLVDVNNLVVNRHNLGTDPEAFLAAVPPDAVAQIHLAGHEVHPTHRIDTHDHPVDTETWALYRRALDRFGAVSTSIERDDHIPPFEEMAAEVAQARSLLERSHSDEAAA
jgi:uncharacterized protein (UPF0276 family)